MLFSIRHHLGGSRESGSRAANSRLYCFNAGFSGAPNGRPSHVLKRPSDSVHSSGYTIGPLQTGSIAVSTGVWTYAVGTNDGTNLKLYLNGSLAASVSSTGFSISDNPFF